ncbi:MAG: hypothetical protein ACKOEP_08995, partial [Phycisphaerales bacterium]
MDHDAQPTAARSPADEARAVASAGADVTLRERCRLFGIEWSDELPEASPGAAERLPPDAAVRLRVVPMRIERGRMVVAMVDP